MLIAPRPLAEYNDKKRGGRKTASRATPGISEGKTAASKSPYLMTMTVPTFFLSTVTA